MHLISIIIPVYNTERYLRGCLDSILVQTYTNWEAVLVDDGSTDMSGVICDEYAEKDSRIKVIHKANEGVSIARFTALKASAGDYVTFVDSDDYVSEYYLERLVMPLITDNVDFTCCQHNDIVEGNVIPSVRTIIGKIEGTALKRVMSENLLYDKSIRLSGMTFYLWAKMFKRDLLMEGLQAVLNIWYGEDQIAILIILYKVSSIRILPDCLYNYIHYPEQVTRRYRDDKWDELYRLWQRLIEIDEQHLLEHQIPYRIWNSSCDFYHDSIPYFHTYGEYEKMTRRIFESDLVRKYVFGGFVKELPRNRFEKILYFLLKYRLYRLLYIEIKRIQKGLKRVNQQ